MKDELVEFLESIYNGTDGEGTLGTELVTEKFTSLEDFMGFIYNGKVVRSFGTMTPLEVVRSEGWLSVFSMLEDSPLTLENDVYYLKASE
jgi:hypothetical protein